jgi:hypothetical protein
MIVVMIGVATFNSETAGPDTNRKGTTEVAVCRNHVVPAEILAHDFPLKIIRACR